MAPTLLLLLPFAAEQHCYILAYFFYANFDFVIKYILRKKKNSISTDILYI